MCAAPGHRCWWATTRVGSLWTLSWPSAALAALLCWHIALGDPHVHKEDGLIQRCAPISGHCFRQAATPDEIATLIRLVDKIGRRRVRGDQDQTPVLLVLGGCGGYHAGLPRVEPPLLLRFV
jgi:hypothetical protein